MSEEKTQGAQDTPETPAEKENEQPAGKPAGEQKPAEGNLPPKEGKVVPEKYDLKLPEGALLDGDDVERIAAYAREQGLSQEQAQKVMERDNAVLASFADRQKALAEEARNTWAEAAKTDKEIGGDNFVKSAEMARRVLDRFGSEEFKQQLNETGFGNHPELIRILSRVGKLLANDTTILGGTDARGPKKTAAELIYGAPKEQ